MGCGCSNSKLAMERKVADISDPKKLMEKRQRARAKSVISNVSSALNIDKTQIKMPLTDRERHTLMGSWERMHQHIVDNGVSMFVR